MSGRLPPAGCAIRLAEARAAVRLPDPEGLLRGGLARRLGAAAVTLHASGREALRVALERLASHSGRREVVIPAYLCFSVPAAAVAAGLRVRLVDVTPRGWLDPAALEKLPLESAAAVVVGNLFGVPEPLSDWLPAARAAGARVVDDAAQALGASSPEGPVGGRADVGLLSFGRGKPLSALGGGALAWSRGGQAVPHAARVAPRRAAALARAAAWNAARLPWVFRVLAALPALGIGETVYDPAFRRGAIDGASLCLAASLLGDLDRANAARAERAHALAGRLAAETRFTPLLAPEGATGVYPRLGVLAPSAPLRAAALAALRHLGASALYPSTLADLPALRPQLAGPGECPGAREFCTRLLTLPTHAGLAGARLEQALRALRGLA
jgi:dTDP-4-amino-4,6-dideoxygalactose transaminase